MSLPDSDNDDTRADLPQRLAALRQQMESGNPEHYRQLALYLQVLRQVLPAAVDQACFHLATQIAPDRYAALPSLKRQALHRHLDALVRQCSSLLTVEQLATLAARLAGERLREHVSQRRRWLEEHGGGVEPGEEPRRQDRPAASSALPTGSVVLGLDLPLGESGGWFHAPAETEPPRLADLDDEHDLLDREEDLLRGMDEDDLLDDNDEDAEQQERNADAFPWDLGLGFAGPGQGPPRRADADAQTAAQPEGLWPDQPGDPSDPEPPGFGTWESGSLARPAPDPPAPTGRGDSPASSASSSAAADPLSVLRASLAAMAAASEASGGRVDADQSVSGLTPLPWRSGALPKDPSQLLLWLEGFDQALTRRLRNLSHAINVEFLRQELTATLLPPSLLDAVLAGHLESQSAPANLLRLPLPLPAAAASQGLIGHALLLRSGDLEGEYPQLRTCRQRLQRQRQELRRMALLQTRLQHRLRTQEAERLWMQTVRRTRTDSR